MIKPEFNKKEGNKHKQNIKLKKESAKYQKEID